jgi:hypothetical protein
MNQMHLKNCGDLKDPEGKSNEYFKETVFNNVNWIELAQDYAFQWHDYH